RGQIKLLKVGANHGGVGTGGQVKSLKGVGRTLVGGLHGIHPLLELGGGGGGQALDDQVGSSPIGEVSKLVLECRLIGLDVAQSGGNPRHTQPRAERV